jgi:hypothetical protein
MGLDSYQRLPMYELMRSLVRDSYSRGVHLETCYWRAARVPTCRTLLIPA